MYTRENGRLVFKYDSDVLMRSFLESGINMMDISNKSTGEPDIETYVEHFPFIDNAGGLVTDEMKRRLFVSPTKGIDNVIRMLVGKEYDKESQTDVKNEYILFSIEDDLYNPADVQAIDNSVYEALVYGALSEWFANSGVPSLITQSKTKQDEAMSHLMFCSKKLECVHLRKQAESPIFDNMIK